MSSFNFVRKFEEKNINECKKRKRHKTVTASARSPLARKHQTVFASWRKNLRVSPSARLLASFPRSMKLAQLSLFSCEWDLNALARLLHLICFYDHPLTHRRDDEHLARMALLLHYFLWQSFISRFFAWWFFCELCKLTLFTASDFSLRLIYFSRCFIVIVPSCCDLLWYQFKGNFFSFRLNEMKWSRLRKWRAERKKNWTPWLDQGERCNCRKFLAQLFNDIRCCWRLLAFPWSKTICQPLTFSHLTWS